jgi:hypothetical protein
MRTFLMVTDHLNAFRNALHGRACTVTKREFDWVFDFGDGCAIAVSSPWRIVAGNRIAHADTDDGQWFGLAQPVDGQARANKLLEKLNVMDVEIIASTADVKVVFADETQIQIFNHSSGYEGWEASYREDGRGASIIGLGGGDLAIVAAN